MMKNLIIDIQQSHMNVCKFCDEESSELPQHAYELFTNGTECSSVLVKLITLAKLVFYIHICVVLACGKDRAIVSFICWFVFVWAEKNGNLWCLLC